MISRRVALVFEALVGMLVTTAGVVIGLAPECVGEMAPIGGHGGIVCSSDLGQRWPLFPVAAVALCVAVLALRELAARWRESDSLLRIGQIPVFGLSAFVLFLYRIHPALAPILGAIALALCAATILFTPPRPRGPTGPADAPQTRTRLGIRTGSS
jgi:hypothetical protein